MKKRGRGRPRKYYFFDDIPEFFKIFLLCRNSQELKIPISWVMQCGEIIHKNTKLKGRDGKLWPVVVEKTDEGVFIKDGWVDFLNHYGVKNGEFLVFKYIGDSTFYVRVFGTDGCKVEALPTESVSREVKVKDEPEETEAKKSCPGPSSSKPNRGLKRSRKVSSKSVKRASDEIEELVVPENPHFIAPMKFRQKYTLTIPREVTSLLKVRKKPEMVLRNEDGKEWPVKLYKCADNRVMLGSGWMQFRRENDLRDSDSCKFTFLKGGSSEVIQVKVLRGHGRNAVGSRG